METAEVGAELLHDAGLAEIGKHVVIVFCIFLFLAKRKDEWQIITTLVVTPPPPPHQRSTLIKIGNTTLLLLDLLRIYQ